ncbi:MAG: LmeA family phospholipid-binding protein, partial [Acidimicrobiales bacterium]
MYSILDRLATRLIGLPVQIRLAISPRLLLGKLSRARILIRGARAGGLFLEEVDVRVSGLAIVPSWPPRLRVAHVEARVHLDQKSLDAWSKRVGLPVRLRLRPGRVVARTGIAGLRLSEADMDVQIEDRTLRLVPRRINVLGMETSGSRLGRVTLPLPRLPRDARLESLDPEESALRACLAVDDLDEELTRERLQAVR